jgi:hypothetical protein
MPFYDQGDLTTLHADIAVDGARQEQIFLQMIDCVQELHSKKIFHRDIKPQNFLRDRGMIRVADLGLSMEQESHTAFTQTGQWGGTQGYMPPEFLAGGFKSPDATSDIFMLGKSFYSLLTQRPPAYLISAGIPDSLFYLIRKCCDQDPARRYQSLSELRQTVVAVYDLLLGRVDGVVRAKNLLAAIVARLAQQQDYSAADVTELLALLTGLPGNDSKSLAMEVPHEFFELLGIAEFAGRVSDFLSFYRVMVEAKGYGFSYAETIALNMATLFRSAAVSDTDKAAALELAICAAYVMNRFAAMETCQRMIKRVDSDSLAFVVRDILLKYKVSFITGIEPVSCAHDLIATTIREMRLELPEAGSPKLEISGTDSGN